MARWKLLQPHYINVPGTTWEYKETSRTTGKPVRREFPVPTFLNPEDPGDCNYSENGESWLIVADKIDDRFPRDIIFVGNPTPDMLPLDDEARAISAKFEKQWSHPINDLPLSQDQSYSQALVDRLQIDLASAQIESTRPAQIEGMTELLATMAAMMKQNQEVLATLAATRVGVAGGDQRRV